MKKLRPTAEKGQITRRYRVRCAHCPEEYYRDIYPPDDKTKLYANAKKFKEHMHEQGWKFDAKHGGWLCAKCWKYWTLHEICSACRGKGREKRSWWRIILFFLLPVPCKSCDGKGIVKKK